MTVRLFRVGGCVRDRILGKDCDDIDFVAVVEDSASVDQAFAAMIAHVEAMGLSVVPAMINRQHVTIKALVPKGHMLRGECSHVDVVLARVDGPSSDGRRPDWVKPGTLAQDLARRDLRINAIAEGPDGSLIDPFNGRQDLADKVVAMVGDPMTRIREDGLRVLRALRFAITLNFAIEAETFEALSTLEAAEMLRGVSSDRIQAELNKMLMASHIATIQTLARFPHVTAVIFAREDLRLTATMKQPKRGK